MVCKFVVYIVIEIVNVVYVCVIFFIVFKFIFCDVFWGFFKNIIFNSNVKIIMVIDVWLNRLRVILVKFLIDIFFLIENN